FTNVPCPWHRLTNLSVSKSSKALRTVPELMPNSRAKSPSLGTEKPGLHWPVAIRSINASRNSTYNGLADSRLFDTTYLRTCGHSHRDHYAPVWRGQRGGPADNSVY